MTVQPSMVNFINVIQAAFTRADPESTKRQLSVFFELLGSARVKAAGRTLMKLTPGVHGTRTLLLPMLIVS